MWELLNDEHLDRLGSIFVLRVPSDAQRTRIQLSRIAIRRLRELARGIVHAWNEVLRYVDILLGHLNIGCRHAEFFGAALESVHYFALDSGLNG